MALSENVTARMVMFYSLCFFIIVIGNFVFSYLEFVIYLFLHSIFVDLEFFFRKRHLTFILWITCILYANY